MSIKNRLYHVYLKRIKHMDDSDIIINRMKKSGIKVGNNCRVFSMISSNEPSLISIGNNVTVSSGVVFCSHDNAIIKAISGKTDVVGKITVGDNCFIGMNSILMLGVTLGNNCIVGAGSVVTHSFEANSVVAGNPARRICSVQEYAEKNRAYAVDFSKIPMDERAEFFNNHKEILIER